MPWKQGSVMDKRIEFVIRAKKKEASISKLCKEFGISRPTGYLWLRRYEDAGTVTALRERSHRPTECPHKTKTSIEDLVVRYRQETGWGARKIGSKLGRQGHRLASSTIHRILIRRGLVKPDPGERKATKRFERSECNEMVQMDFKGEYEVTEGKCYPLSFLDDHSRYLMGLWPLPSTGAAGVVDSLKTWFRKWGVPQSILTDHGTPWYSTTNGHGLTWVSVWLIKQAIKLKFSGIRHPQTHGKVERFHRTLKMRTRHRGEPSTMDEWRRWATEFAREYNEERPHEALQMRTPAEVYTTQNLRPYQENPPEWEYSGGTVLRLNTQGGLYYRGRQYFVCEALASERVRVDELEENLEVTFRRTTVREINLRTGRSVAVVLDRLT